MRKHAIRLVALVVLFSACTSDATVPTVPSVSGTAADPTVVTSVGTVGTTPAGPVGLFASELVEFDTCAAFLDHVKSEALARVGPYGFGSGDRFFAETDMVVEEAPAEDDSGGEGSASSAGTAGVDYSTTNVQEVGVDEPDIVKTDGNRILALAYGALHYIDVSSGEPELVSTLPLLSWQDWDLWNHQLFMSGDTALLMASGYTDLMASFYRGDQETITLVAQVDLSEPRELRVTRTLTVEAAFVSARLVGDRATLVLTSEPRVSLDFVYPSSDSTSSELRAEGVNRTVIEESTAEHWVPRYELTVGTDGKPTEGSLIDCSAAYAPQESSGFGTLSVLTLDLAEQIDVESVATVMSGGDTVYASTDRLYVASHRWIDWDDPDEGDTDGITTHIHRFDIGGSDGPLYQASGSVDGFLLSQFAMSEHDGYLRVASTDAPPWGWSGDERASESRVDVLEQDGRQLKAVGSVAGLGKGERIFAVRFIGEVGYVVTFRQTDPLYTIDLSDPTDPQVVGELKILGYSAYLHPIGEGLLLGVGQDADEQGRISGTQISIFDVSDLAYPVRTHQYKLPESSRTEVEFNHRAFLYWPPTGMAVLPVGWWGYRNGSEEWVSHNRAIVLGVGPEGIDEFGMIAHELKPDGSYEDLYGYDLYAYMDSVPIGRSLVVGGTLFTLSWIGLKGSDLASLSETSWIRFPQEEYIDY